MRTAEEFWAKVQQGGGCWLWTGSHTSAGYGNLRWLDGWTYAHRVAYELTRGPIPDGLVIDHLCRNRGCVRPDHLEAVEVGENTRRGLRTYAIRTRCKHGHDITDPSNVAVSARGYKHCRTCANTQRRARRRAA